MPVPTFIQDIETVWNNTTLGKTTATFNTLNGDVLVAFAIKADWLSGHSAAITNNGAALTWTERQSILVVQRCLVYVWTSVLSADRTGLTVTFTQSANTANSGGSVITFRDSGGVGASSKTNVASGAPSLNITTTQINSAIVVVNSDWDSLGGASRVWRTGAGSMTEITYHRTAAQYTNYAGYHGNVASIGTYEVGLTTPTTQQYSIIALEVLGTITGHPTARRLGSFNKRLGSSSGRVF